MVEGTPLLRERGVYSLTEGSNPSLSAKHPKTRTAYGFAGFFFLCYWHILIDTDGLVSAIS